jgi:hypothetical protein
MEKWKVLPEVAQEGLAMIELQEWETQDKGAKFQTELTLEVRPSP